MSQQCHRISLWKKCWEFDAELGDGSCESYGSQRLRGNHHPWCQNLSENMWTPLTHSPMIPDIYIYMIDMSPFQKIATWIFSWLPTSQPSTLAVHTWYPNHNASALSLWMKPCRKLASSGPSGHEPGRGGAQSDMLDGIVCENVWLQLVQFLRLVLGRWYFQVPVCLQATAHHHFTSVGCSEMHRSLPFFLNI